MTSLRLRLTLWFGLSLVLVVLVLAGSAYWHLDYELRKEKWERTHPTHPDWTLHASFTEKEVHDILRELVGFWLIVGVPTVGLALGAAYLLARHSMEPVRRVNEQLASLSATTLAQRVSVPENDAELKELARHLNDLLARLERSFAQLQEYTTQVAHELRTPLQLMRLRVEKEAASLDPDLAEELEEELARLSAFVERALTIARAEQGRLETHFEAIALKAFLEDFLEPFSRLAESDGRRLVWCCADGAAVRTDRSAFKQILFNLLNNALRHGTGDIVLRARVRAKAVCLLIGNRVPAEVEKTRPGLGIGLRLVRALAQQLGETRLQTRRAGYYWVKLRMPAA